MRKENLNNSTYPLANFGRIKAIVFDLDGTLLNSIEDIANANNRMLEKHGFPTYTVAKYIEWISNGAAQLVRLSLPEGTAENEQDFQAYVEGYKAEYKKNLIVKSRLYNGISQLLNSLKEKGIPMALNSNKPHDQTLLIAEHFLKSYGFKIIQGQKDEIPRKPDPAGALLIAGHLETDPKKMIYIGDSVVDVRTAKAAGMRFLGVTWGYGKKAAMEGAGCTDFVNTPEELERYIEEQIGKI